MSMSFMTCRSGADILRTDCHAAYLPVYDSVRASSCQFTYSIFTKTNLDGGQIRDPIEFLVEIFGKIEAGG